MTINDELLQKLETLSSLKIEDNKRVETIKQLSEIVNFVENLNELNLEENEATFTTIDTSTPLREDIPHVDNTTIKTILKYAPKSSDTFFIVPKIIE